MCVSNTGSLESHHFGPAKLMYCPEDKKKRSKPRLTTATRMYLSMEKNVELVLHQAKLKNKLSGYRFKKNQGYLLEYMQDGEPLQHTFTYLQVHH